MQVINPLEQAVVVIVAVEESAGVLVDEGMDAVAIGGGGAKIVGHVRAIAQIDADRLVRCETGGLRPVPQSLERTGRARRLNLGSARNPAAGPPESQSKD